MARHANKRVSRRKVLLTLAVLAAGATAVGAGTYASFTSTASAGPLTVGSGTQTFSVAGAGSGNRMSVSASNIVPGDTIQRSFTLTNNGTVNLSAITLTTNATTSSVLDTDATNGLQLVIDKCSQAWSEAGAGPAYTYTCGGTTTSVLGSRAVIGSATLSNMSALTASGTDNLRLTLTFPGTAGDSFQNKSSTITFRFDGVQRTAGNA